MKLRASYSKAIRAPDIFELFSPQQAATFRPSDPCNSSDLNARIATGMPHAQTRKDNCAAALTALGVNPNTFEDTLTARCAGTSGGNPKLLQEEATPWTAGGVLQPRFAPGLLLSADDYRIEIDDAIAPVTAQNIVNNCYDLSTFPNQFCPLFDRRADGGFSSLRQVRTNFGRIETSGAAVSAAYNFIWADNRFKLRTTLNGTQKIDRYFDPVDTSLVNPGLGELSAPEWSGTANATWARGPVSLTWRGQYIGKQAVAIAVQSKDRATGFGPAGIAPACRAHGLAASCRMQPGIELYGGGSNPTNERPYLASSAYPVGGVGRSFFAGVLARF